MEEITNNNTTSTEPVTKSPDPNFIKFIKNVNPSHDPVTMILHCHLLAEYYFDQLVISSMPRGDVISDKLTFANKLLIIRALNIIDICLLDSLSGLNNIRNHCSHVLNYQVNESDIDRIGRPFGKKYSQSKIKYLNNEKELLFDTLMTLMAKLTFTVTEYINKN